ncbi:hypothetical protein [Flaviflagellibacter deserti]|uniref:Uncharacterized protein n=1 Tax=Flaviflagellibacter deserti TaxID=2267266 RepID=A0ABV9Z279_9HYPH
MRMIAILAAGAALAFATAANAQAPSAQQPSVQPPTAAPTSPPAATPTIQSIDIVDMNELPESTQTQVNKVVAQRGDGDLQRLRASIDASPKIKSELEAKGLTSAHVIVASLGPDGTLTLVTRKAS